MILIVRLDADRFASAVIGEAAAAARIGTPTRVKVVLSSILQALGFLAADDPLYYLFRAVRGAQHRVRRSWSGWSIIAPIFFADLGRC